MANRRTPTAHCVATSFEWNANDFNPDHGGINRHVWLHVTGKIHQTLPLYYGLESQGVYVHAGNFNIAKKTADVTVDAEVHNASGDRATVGLSVVIVDHSGQRLRAVRRRSGRHGGRREERLTAAGPLKDARFWSPEDPYLYDVYTILKVDGKVVDVKRIETGFRKAEFKGGAGTGGVYINDKFVYLKGFAQRSTDEWAGLGAGYPDWMHDYTAKLIRDCHGNYMRWMHISPQKVDADSLRALRHHPGLSRGRQGARCHGTPVGPARRGDARFDHLLPQQSQHPLLGGGQHRGHARPDAADGRAAQAVGSRRRPRDGRARQRQRATNTADHADRGVLRRDDRPGHADGRR